jgi:hypothetical protein
MIGPYDPRFSLRQYHTAIDAEMRSLNEALEVYLRPTADAGVKRNDVIDGVLSKFSIRVANAGDSILEAYAESLALVVLTNAVDAARSYRHAQQCLLLANRIFRERDWPARLFWSSQIHFVLGAHILPRVSTLSDMHETCLVTDEYGTACFPTQNLICRLLTERRVESESKTSQLPMEYVKELLCFHALAAPVQRFLEDSTAAYKEEAALGLILDSGYKPERLRTLLLDPMPIWGDPRVPEPSQSLVELVTSLAGAIEAVVFEREGTSLLRASLTELQAVIER